MALTVSNETWRIVAEAKYSTTAARNTAQAAVQTIIDGYPGLTPRAGRYAAGTNQPTTTSFTISYETADESEAVAVRNAIKPSITNSANRTGILSAVYRGNTE